VDVSRLQVPFLATQTFFQIHLLLYSVPVP
jgi:hypothetical protein